MDGPLGVVSFEEDSEAESVIVSDGAEETPSPCTPPQPAILDIRFERLLGLGTTEVHVYYPTMDQIADFSLLIRSIEHNGAHHDCGICKIVPPPEWKPRPSKANYKDTASFIIQSPVQETILSTKPNCYVKELKRFKKEITVDEFYSLATKPKYRNPKAGAPQREMDEEFWRQITLGEEAGGVDAIYGADTEGSLFDDDVDEFNMNRLGTILDDMRLRGSRIAGVNTVYLYFGMYKACFPWHAEDVDLYSINYVHHGAAKHWWAIPAEAGDRFERLMHQLFPEPSSECSAFLRHKNHMVHPDLLLKFNIPFGSVVQNENEIIITFPRGFHMGYNTGYNIAESTNFAIDRWIDFAKNAVMCDCKPSSVKIDMRPYMEKYRSAEFPAWNAHWFQNKVEPPPKVVRGKRKICAPGSPVERRNKRIRKKYADLFSRVAPNLYKEKAFNERASLCFPFCAVCQAFVPQSLVVTSISGIHQLPKSSPRFVRNACFTKGVRGEGEEEVEGDEPPEDELVSCINCRVTVHRGCYAMDNNPDRNSFKCVRCKQQDDVRIRSSMCCLCELRGGPLIPAYYGMDSGVHVHVVCAILHRRTWFRDPKFRATAEILPPAKHGPPYRTLPLRDDYVNKNSNLHNFAHQCSVCMINGEGLASCGVCETAETGEPTLAHATCALLAGMHLEQRYAPDIAVLCCDRHKNEYYDDGLNVGDAVTVDGEGGTSAGIYKGDVGLPELEIDFYNGTSTDDTPASYVVWCACKRTQEQKCAVGKHVYGSLMRVRWDDGRVYWGYFRGAGTTKQLLVEINGVVMVVEADDVVKVTTLPSSPKKKRPSLTSS